MKSNFVTNFKILKLVFKTVPFYVITSILFVFLDAFNSLIDLYLIENLIKMIEKNNANFNDALMFILIAVGLRIICTIFCNFQRGYIRQRSRHKWIKKVQHMMFERARCLGIEYFDDPELYDKLSRSMTQDLTSINCFDSFMTMLTALGNILVLVVYISLAVPALFVITLLTSLISFFCYIRINKNDYKLYKEQEIDLRKSGYIRRTFYLEKYAMDIKTTNVYNLLLEAQNDAYVSRNKKCIKTDKLNRKWVCFEDVVYQIVNNFVVYAYLMYQVFYNGMLLSSFTALATAALRFNNRFYSLSWSISSLNENLLKVREFLWLLNYEPEEDRGIKEIKNNDFNLIKVNNLSFKYPNQDNYSLKDLTFTLKKNQKIAVIGYNGAGKTTLTKLLLKLYEPSDGNIEIDGVKYEDVSKKALSKLYTIVLQNFQIYCATIAENVLMKKVETESEKQIVVDALKKVGIYEIVEKLPDGINTILTKEFNNDGLELSGGERQKIAVARVFASNAPVIILDEPTSALDPIAEKEINDEIMNLCEKENKTLIIISHRLSTIVNVDTIFMMKEGSIIEVGTHHELMKNKGSYFEMFEAQAKLYRETKEQELNE